MGNNILTEFRPELGTTLFIVSTLGSFIGLLGAFTGLNPGGVFTTFGGIISWLGGWTYWIALLGPIGFVFALWWVLDYILKVRKLKDLIDTSSKAKLLKNLDDVEYIAWRLPRKYKIMVAQKKQELKIEK